jgi:uncharacterized protein
MLELDMSVGQAFLAANPPPGELLLCAVSGAHLYGFPSPDSDLDLKGIHLTPTAALLGLSAETPVYDRIEVFQGVECDVTTNEARDALKLLLAGNGNMLERILSPHQLVESPDIAELQELARGAISAGFARHYGGFFRSRLRELELRPTVKALLYAYRVALTGIHLMRTGELEANLVALLPHFASLHNVEELIAMKRAGEEKGALASSFLTQHESQLDTLDVGLTYASQATQLPLVAQNRDAVDDWLVRKRLSRLA